MAADTKTDPETDPKSQIDAAVDLDDQGNIVRPEPEQPRRGSEVIIPGPRPGGWPIPDAGTVKALVDPDELATLRHSSSLLDTITGLMAERNADRSRPASTTVDRIILGGIEAVLKTRHRSAG